MVISRRDKDLTTVGSDPWQVYQRVYLPALKTTKIRFPAEPEEKALRGRVSVRKLSCLCCSKSSRPFVLSRCASHTKATDMRAHALPSKSHDGSLVVVTENDMSRAA